MRIIQVTMAAEFLERMLRNGAEQNPTRVIKGLPPDAKLCAVEFVKQLELVHFHFATADENGPQFEGLSVHMKSYPFEFPEEEIPSLENRQEEHEN